MVLGFRAASPCKQEVKVRTAPGLPYLGRGHLPETCPRDLGCGGLVSVSPWSSILSPVPWCETITRSFADSAETDLVSGDVYCGHFRQKFLNRFRAQLGVSHGVLNILVSEPSLERPRVVPSVSERIATAVSQHVGVHGERRLRAGTNPAKQRMSLAHSGKLSGGMHRSLITMVCRKTGCCRSNQSLFLLRHRREITP